MEIDALPGSQEQLTSLGLFAQATQRAERLDKSGIFSSRVIPFIIFARHACLVWSAFLSGDVLHAGQVRG